MSLIPKRTCSIPKEIVQNTTSNDFGKEYERITETCMLSDTCKIGSCIVDVCYASNRRHSCIGQYLRMQLLKRNSDHNLLSDIVFSFIHRCTTNATVEGCIDMFVEVCLSGNMNNRSNPILRCLRQLNVICINVTCKITLRAMVSTTLLELCANDTMYRNCVS